MKLKKGDKITASVKGYFSEPSYYEIVEFGGKLMAESVNTKSRYLIAELDNIALIV